MFANTACFGGHSGLPQESQVRSTITFADIPADSQAQTALTSLPNTGNTVSVKVSFEGETSPPTFLKNLKVSCDPRSKQILLAPLVRTIHEMGVELDNCVISYWSEADQLFVLVGRYPLTRDKKISYSELDAQNVI